jgi:hypothetical protein
MRHSSCRTTLDVYTRAVDQQKREARKVVKMMLPLDAEKFQHPSAPSDTKKGTCRCRQIAVNKWDIGGPDRDRTDDLFHAMAPRCPHFAGKTIHAGESISAAGFGASRRFCIACL